MNDLRHDLSKFPNNCETIHDNFSALHAIIIKLLDKHAPIKTRRVKSNRLPAWYTPEIGLTRIARDKCKRFKHWVEYKRLRNKTRILIRNAKRQHFSSSVENSKDTSVIWRHLRIMNKGSLSSGKMVPDKLTINGETFTDPKILAIEFNEFFTSIAGILNDTSTWASELNVDEFKAFVNNKVPDEVRFSIPLITTDQVLSYIHF